MNENSMWQTLRKGMAGLWIPTRLETSTGNGVPDIAFAIADSKNRPIEAGKFGFMELKYIPKWPKREGTLVKLPLRPEQKLWLKSRGDLAGNCWVLVRIEDHFFLLDHTEAIEAADGWEQKRYFDNFNWYMKIDYKALADALSWND
jgi:hypothetical protein